jgi:hypothetical protein
VWEGVRILLFDRPWSRRGVRGVRGGLLEREEAEEESERVR